METTDLKSQLMQEKTLVEEQLLQAEKKYKALKELKANNNFKEIILDGFLTDKLKELVSIRYIHSFNAIASTVESAKLQDDLTAKFIDSMFFLQGYFNEIELNYNLLLNRKAEITKAILDIDTDIDIEKE